MAFQFNIPTDNSPSPLLQLSDAFKDYNRNLQQQNSEVFAMSRNNMENSRLQMEKEKQPLLMEGLRQGNEARALEIEGALLQRKGGLLQDIKRRIDANPGDATALADYDRLTKDPSMSGLMSKYGNTFPKDVPGALNGWLALTKGYEDDYKRRTQELELQDREQRAAADTEARRAMGIDSPKSPANRVRPTPGMTPPTPAGTGYTNPDGVSQGQRSGPAGSPTNPGYVLSSKDGEEGMFFTSKDRGENNILTKQNGVVMTLAEFQARGGQVPQAVAQAPAAPAPQPQASPEAPADQAMRHFQGRREALLKLVNANLGERSKAAAEQIKQMDEQLKTGTIVGPDGRVHSVPGYAESKRTEEAAKEEGKKRQENYQKSVSAFNEASDLESTARDVKVLANQAITGSAADYELNARKIAARLGFSDDRIPATELLRSALTKFVAAEAQKMKPVSNSDITFLQNAVGGLSSDPRSLTHIAGAWERAAARQKLYHELEAQFYHPDMKGQQGYVDARAIKKMVDERLPSYVASTFGTPQEQQSAAEKLGTQPGAPPQQGQAPGAAPGNPTPIQQQLLGQPDGTRVGMYVIKNGKVVLAAPSPGEQQAPPPGPAPQPNSLPPGIASELPPGYPAQRVQMRRQAEATQAEAQRAQQLAQVQGQFDTDARSMHPVEVARKYDSMRSLLSERQLLQLNELISTLSRRR